MSHRCFNCEGIDILTGWDVQKKHYYLLVKYEDNILFSNEALINPAMTLEDVMRYVKKFKIVPPGSLFFDLAMDEELNIDTLIKDYRETPAAN